MAERFRLGPVVTASSWRTLATSVWNQAQRARGLVRDSRGTVAPKLTNREAASLVEAMRAAAPMTSAGFPLWYHFAAASYGWLVNKDRFDTSAAQADRMYPADLSVELQLALSGLASDLDAERATVPPRLELDPSAFDDPLFRGDVLQALRDDHATVSTKIPLPACRDRKTGKVRVPLPPCGPDGTGPVNPLDPKGPRLPCDKPGDCAPIVVDDPITAVGSSIGKLLLLAVAAFGVYKVLGSKARRSRRSRR